MSFQRQTLILPRLLKLLLGSCDFLESELQFLVEFKVSAFKSSVYLERNYVCLETR